MTDENQEVPQTEVPATPETAQPEVATPADEGKPVGPATVVQDDPIEQFPAHDENISGQ